MSDKTLVDLIRDRKKLLDRRKKLKKDSKAWQDNELKITAISQIILRKQDPR